MVTDICEFVPGWVASGREFCFLRQLESHQGSLAAIFEFVDSPQLSGVAGFAAPAAAVHIPPLEQPFFYSPELADRSAPGVRARIDGLRREFAVTYALLDRLSADNAIIRMSFARILAGTVLPLCVDDYPQVYRAQLGIRLPKSGCCLRVNDTVVKWRTDRCFVCDPTQPSMRWNLSDEDCVVMQVDFFRPPAAAVDVQQLQAMRRATLSSYGDSQRSTQPDPGALFRFNHLVEVIES